MAKLILARHHESEWNKIGLWTGMRDRHLTPYGFEKAEEMGGAIKDIQIDRAFASMLVRSIETLSSMLNVIGEYNVPVEYAAALNERNYGDYTGKDKWEMLELIGEERWDNIRRAWNCPVPNGETLKMVYERTIPYFLEKILPAVNKGEVVLVVAHGNSCRALMKYIENISDEGIKNVEMPFGAIYIYDLDNDGHVLKKEVRQVQSNVHA
jgi:2,3-bisphosphoglycerate-dependent phosphoglycerate mutase